MSKISFKFPRGQWVIVEWSYLSTRRINQNYIIDPSICVIEVFNGSFEQSSFEFIGLVMLQL